MVLMWLIFLNAVALPIVYLAADDNADDLWKAYKVKYQKNYGAADEGARRVIWQRNVWIVSKHNLEADFGLHTYRMELNKFSDKTKEELDVYRKCFKRGNENGKATAPVKFTCNKTCSMNLPKAVDWRTKGLVTYVKDQGDCGSCWAFSATGSLEGQNKAKKGILVPLSEQNLIDCSWNEGNEGCDGGLMEYAFQYVIDNQGIDTEHVYPYKGSDRICNFRRKGVGANCTKFGVIRSMIEMDLQAAVANIGPISVAIDASSDKFMNYKEGIYYDHSCSSTHLDHGVLVVGYGSEDGNDYWIVKNSWGKTWGMDGYILMARNAGNQCGIATQASYPIM